jgi:hypothetical protein
LILFILLVRDRRPINPLLRGGTGLREKARAVGSASIREARDIEKHCGETRSVSKPQK